jgi:hypothetical protein
MERPRRKRNGEKAEGLQRKRNKLKIDNKLVN